MTFEDITVYQPGGGRIKNIQTQEHDSRAKWLAGLSTVGHRKQSQPLLCDVISAYVLYWSYLLRQLLHLQSHTLQSVCH